MRDFDKIHDFKSKYPFGTIHFLICLLSNMKVSVEIPKNAVGIIMFADGVFKSIMNYPENCVNWLNWLGAKELKFFNNFSKISISKIVHQLHDVFNNLHLPSGRINLKTISSKNLSIQFSNIEKLLEQISTWTGWKLKQSCWKVLEFNNLCEPVKINRKRAEGVNNSKYQKILKRKGIISFSFPSSTRLEYSIEKG